MKVRAFVPIMGMQICPNLSVGIDSMHEPSSNGHIVLEVEQALPRFRQILEQAGFDTQRPSPRTAWRVFNDFVREPVACADDGVLFQCGLSRFTGEERFYLDFVRQFSIEVDGEYDHMEQLHCEFTREPTALVRDLDWNQWAYDWPDLERYFAHVESQQEFQLAMAEAGWTFDLSQEAV
jgi:hypothetical protein